jgi:uncharacterized membrane protein YphA (DoxX/SURF4 family)
MKRGLGLALRIGLGALFVVAGLQKWRDPAAFTADIANYRLLPALAPWLAATLPAVEVVAGVALIALGRPWRRAAGLAIALMVLVFTGAAGSALARGIDVACGCFGAGGDSVDALTIVRDLALLGAAVGAVLLDRPAPDPDPSSASGGPRV